MRNRSSNEEDTEINMTPMLDIVFIMLIFFIVTAVFVKEAGLEIDKPQAETTRSQSKASIMIAISANDEVWLNRDKVEIAAIKANVEKLHTENPRGTIVIQADEKSSAGVWMQVYDEVRKAGVPRIATSAEK